MIGLRGFIFRVLFRFNWGAKGGATIMFGVLESLVRIYNYVKYKLKKNLPLKLIYIFVCFLTS